MIPRLLFAFLRRDAAIHLSYRLEFFLDLLSIIFSVATFYFVARLFTPASQPGGPAAQPLGPAAGALAAYGGDYFSFVVIGIAFSAYQGVGLHSFAQSIRQEQYLGTLESILAAPVRVSTFLLASAQWDFLYATLQVAFYLVTGIFIFGLRLDHADLPAAAAVVLLTLAAFVSLGVASAAFILRFKRGDPVAWVIGTVSELLGGVYFPTSILPGWLKRLSQFIPMSHALEALRLTLLRGAGLSEVRVHALALMGFTALFLPLGIFLFKQALDSARREGSLGHY